MSGDREDRGATDEAKDFLTEALSDGPLAAKEVKRQAEEAGIASRTLKRAKRVLSVEARREGGIAERGRWLVSANCSLATLMSVVLRKSSICGAFTLLRASFGPTRMVFVRSTSNGHESMMPHSF